MAASVEHPPIDGQATVDELNRIAEDLAALRARVWQTFLDDVEDGDPLIRARYVLVDQAYTLVQDTAVAVGAWGA